MAEIQLFTKMCIYSEGETLIYGQYKNSAIKSVNINGEFVTVIQNQENSDFCIVLKGKYDNLYSLVINTGIMLISQTNVILKYPFDSENIELSDKSAIILTICKDYSHRLDEWIQYNLKLGFSGIVIFDNSGNKSNGLNESLENCISNNSMREICNKYKEKVILVDFSYSAFKNEHWNTIQRIVFHCGINYFRNKCKYIALIDADEFIYLPKNPLIKIEEFLTKYNCTISMKSNVLTNKNSNDIINNNVLEVARYVGEDMFTKVILCTELIRKNEFINTPHKHKLEIKLDKEEIIHYHCWINKRYEYKESMLEIDFLYDFLKN
jgi:hypothetical protein